MPAPETITVAQLTRLIGTPEAPSIIDVRSEADRISDPRFVLASTFRADDKVPAWAADYTGQAVAVVCQLGHKLSQGVAAWLRQAGAHAEYLEGGSRLGRKSEACWCSQRPCPRATSRGKRYG